MKYILCSYLGGFLAVWIAFLWLEYRDWKLLTRKNVLLGFLTGLFWPFVLSLIVFLSVALVLSILISPLTAYIRKRLEKQIEAISDWLDKPIIGG